MKATWVCECAKHDPTLFLAMRRAAGLPAASIFLGGGLKMKASSILMVVAVVVVVAGVAWYRTAREAPVAETPAPLPGSPPAAAPLNTPLPNPAAVEPARPAAPPAAHTETAAGAGSAAATPAAPATEAPSSPPAEPATPATGEPAAAPAPAAQPAATPEAAAAPKKLPRVVDLGADKCIPCKKMAPILVELRKEYEGRVTVDFIDVWKNPNAGQPYKIRVIPTQIFFDADGKEVWRHEGFLSKEEFVAKFAEMGVK